MLGEIRLHDTHTHPHTLVSCPLRQVESYVMDSPAVGRTGQNWTARHRTGSYSPASACKPSPSASAPYNQSEFVPCPPTLSQSVFFSFNRVHDTTLYTICTVTQRDDRRSITFLPSLTIIFPLHTSTQFFHLLSRGLRGSNIDDLVPTE